MSDELVEGNKENKAKKNAAAEKVAVRSGTRSAGREIEKGGYYNYGTKPEDSLARSNKMKMRRSEKKYDKYGPNESVEHEEVMPTLYSFIEALVAGDLDAADEFLETSLAFKVDATLDALKTEVAESLFDEELEEEVEVISQEEFDALSEDEQAEYEEVELEEIEEGNAANKVKKNAVAKKMSKLNRLSVGRMLQKGSVWASKNGMPQDTLTTSNKMKAVRVKRKFAESTEQIDELKKSTLGSYVRRASGDVAIHASAHTQLGRKGDYEGEAKSLKRVTKRFRGINAATRKLAKEGVEQIEEGNAANKAKKNAYVETAGKNRYTKSGSLVQGRAATKRGRNSDLRTLKTNAVMKHVMRKAAMRNEGVEQIDELQKSTLKNYVNKAASSAFLAGDKVGSSKLGSEKNMKGYEKGTKRLRGIRTAVSKLAKESVEQIDELSNKTLKSYAKKAAGSIAKKNASGVLDKKRATGIMRATRKLGVSHGAAERASSDASMERFHKFKGDKTSAADSAESKNKNLRNFRKTVNAVKEETV